MQSICINIHTPLHRDQHRLHQGAMQLLSPSKPGNRAPELAELKDKEQNTNIPMPKPMSPK